MIRRVCALGVVTLSDPRDRQHRRPRTRPIWPVGEEAVDGYGEEFAQADGTLGGEDMLVPMKRLALEIADVAVSQQAEKELKELAVSRGVVVWQLVVFCVQYSLCGPHESSCAGNADHAPTTMFSE